VSATAGLRAIVNPETGELEIRIDVDILAFAAMQWARGEQFEQSQGQIDAPALEVRYEDDFAAEVARELMREDEAGESLLTRCFDKAFKAVLHHGTCAATVLEAHSQDTSRP
jgi:hypothetical protein